MIQTNTVGAGKTAAAGAAHVAFLTADGDFAAFQADCLARVETAGSDALRNPLLLVFAALVDGGGMAMHGNGCGLGKANGGSKCE
jgi:hypothetical protein